MELGVAPNEVTPFFSMISSRPSFRCFSREPNEMRDGYSTAQDAAVVQSLA